MTQNTGTLLSELETVFFSASQYTDSLFSSSPSSLPPPLPTLLPPSCTHWPPLIMVKSFSILQKSSQLQYDAQFYR